jgi:hypothetical protein
VLSRYRIYVTTSTTQAYDVLAHSEDEVHDLWQEDVSHFIPTGTQTTTEDVVVSHPLPLREEDIR